MLMRRDKCGGSLESQLHTELYIHYNIPLLSYTTTGHVITLNTGSILLNVDGSHCIKRQVTLIQLFL